MPGSDLIRERVAEFEEELSPIRYVRTVDEQLIFDSENSLNPEIVGRMVRGLRQHFTASRFSVEYDRHLRVFAKESDPHQLELMRAFCTGFAASL